MSFLAPLFLFGALAIAGPIIFHLIRRTTKEHTPFSSLMFLKPTPPRVTRRSRLENLWLLLLRCLIVLLLAFAFARPLFQESTAAPASADGKRRTVILVDASASMRRGDLWKDAEQKVDEWLRKATAEDDFAVLAFSRATTTLVSFEQWRNDEAQNRVAAALNRLNTLQPTWFGTGLGPALLQAAEILDAGRDAKTSAEIVLISDLQEGAKLDGLQGYSWPKGIRVILDSVSTRAEENASLQWLPEIAPTADRNGRIRVRVQSDPATKREQFRVQWQGGSSVDGLDVYVPAGQSRIAHVPAPPKGAEKLVLSGDAVDFDNMISVVPPEPMKLAVLFVGGDSPDDPQGALYYIHRGFPPTSQQIVEVIVRNPDGAPSAYEMQRAQLMVLGEGLTDATVDAAREFANEGKLVLYPVPSAKAGLALARLLGLSQVSLEESKVRQYALLGQIDFRHPLFVPFADPRYSDFTKIHFWKYRVLKSVELANARIVAKFDDQAPAIVQMPVGKGGVVVLTTTWRPADSQLALSSKFVPLLHSLLEQSSGLAPRQPQYFVGDSVPLPPSPGDQTVHTPSGEQERITDGASFTATIQPGIYRIEPGQERFVVNLPAEESRLAPFDSARLTALGVPLQREEIATATENVADPAALQATEVEARQKLWRWLLLGVVIVLLLETPIAARLSQSPRQPVSS